MLKIIIALCLAAAAAASSLWSSEEAKAQSTCPYIVYEAVLTAAQWAQCFEGKQDALGFTPIAPTNIIATPPLTASVLGQNVTLTCPTCVVTTGSTMTGELVTAASAAGGAGFNLPPGTAPTSPVNGDLWTTSGGLFARVAGATVGPYGVAPIAANPSATAGPAAVIGSAATFMRSDAAPAVQKGSSSIFGIIEVDGSTITAAGGVISAVGGVATAVTVGVTTIGSGATGKVLYQNGASPTGTIGEYSITGTGNVVMSASPTLTGTATMPDSGTYGSGGINGSVIGATTPEAGTFAGLTATGSFTATGLVVNADLANPSATVGGATCTLGSTCQPNIAMGTTSLTGSATTGAFLIAQAAKVQSSADSAYTGSYLINMSSVAATSVPPLPTLGLNSAVQIVGNDAGTQSVALQLNGFTNGIGPLVVLAKALGSASSPTALGSAAIFGVLMSSGYDGAAYSGLSAPSSLSNSLMLFKTTEAWSSTAHGSEIDFYTVANTTTAGVKAVVIGQDQSLTAFGNLVLETVTTGGFQCLHASNSGVVSGTGGDCGSSGSVTITAGATPTSGFTTNDLLASNGSSKVVDSGVNFGSSFTFTATLTANTAVTFPTSGTLATTSQLASLPLAQVNGGCGGNAWCGFSAALTTTGTGAPTLAFPSSSFTYTFPGASANMDYQVGSFVSGHCLQASGTAGGIADSGGTCGGSSGVASVGNASADTTLTIAGTGSGPWTGSVTAKINLANANVWTALQTHSFNAASLPTAITNSIIRAANSDTNISRIVAEGYGAIAALTVARADSTAASPTGVLSGEQIGGFNAYAWGSNAAWNGSIASLRVYAAENISGTAWGSKACIGTTAVTTTTLTDSLCQGNDGGVTVGSPTGGDKGAGTINAAGLYVNGTAIGGGSPGGATTNIQFNLSGVLSGDSGLTYAGSGGVLTLTPAANTAQPLLITGGSTTGSGTAALGIGVVGTLNTTGLVDGAAFFANITNTASANNSLIADVQIGGVSAFSIANKRSSSTISFVTVNSTLTAMSSSTSMFAAIEGGSLAVVGTGGIISASTAGNGSFTGYRQGGTIASPTALGSGNIIVTYQGVGYDGTTNAQGAGMYVTADQAWTSTAHGTRLAFFATADSTTAFNEKMRLQASGGLTIGNGILSTDPGAGALITSAPITPSSGYTVAALPASPPTGSIAYVTDAIACTFLASLTGGGSTFCPVSYNGSAWVGG